MQLVPGVVSFFSPIWASCNHLVLSCQLLAAAVHQLVLGTYICPLVLRAACQLHSVQLVAHVYLLPTTPHECR